MSGARPDVEQHLTGPAAPPTANGELLFEAPWEARVFGMAHALCDAGLFRWADFQAALIAEIARWERDGADAGEAYRYYERFQAALETLLDRLGPASGPQLAARATALAARPHGHDHHHGEHHDHDH
ncbi:MAG: nitrile hydratase accessory protein [Pseudomonadales bacterium]|nr:nitrile hydratase accessory protein [Pseudomonadales bacterium]